MQCTIANRLDELPLLLDIAQAFAEANGMPRALALRVRLIVEELAGNAIRHGYRDGRAEFVALSLSHDGVLRCTLEDDGDPFDPLSDPRQPDRPMNPEERPVGGLGVHIVRTWADNVAYSHVNGHNRVSLTVRPSSGAT